MARQKTHGLSGSNASHELHLTQTCLLQAKLLVPPEGAQGEAAGEITQVAASPAGSHIAAGHADGTIRLWNTDTGDCEVWPVLYCSVSSAGCALHLSTASSLGTESCRVGGIYLSSLIAWTTMRGPKSQCRISTLV